MKASAKIVEFMKNATNAEPKIWEQTLSVSAIAFEI